MKYFRCKISEDGGYQWRICSRVLFIAPHKGVETSEAICQTLETPLKQVTAFEISAFEKNFTFDTDWAAVMAKKFVSSVSMNKVPFGERWVGCISHQLNTVIKSVVESGPIKSTEMEKI